MLIFIIIIVLILAALLYKKFYGSADFDPETLIPLIGVYINDCHEYYFIDIKNLNKDQAMELGSLLSKKGTQINTYSRLIFTSDKSDAIIEELGFKKDYSVYIHYLIKKNTDLNYFLLNFDESVRFAKEDTCKITDILSKDELDGLRVEFKKLSGDSNKKNTTEKIKPSKNDNGGTGSYEDLAKTMEKYIDNYELIKLADSDEPRHLEEIFFRFAEFYFTFEEIKYDDNKEALPYWTDCIKATMEYLLQFPRVKKFDDSLNEVLNAIYNVLYSASLDIKTVTVIGLQGKLIDFGKLICNMNPTINFYIKKITYYDVYTLEDSTDGLEEGIKNNIEKFVQQELDKQQTEALVKRNIQYLTIFIELYVLRLSIRKTFSKKQKITNSQDQATKMINKLSKIKYSSEESSEDFEFNMFCTNVLKVFRNADILMKGKSTDFMVIKNLHNIFEEICKLEKYCNIFI